MTNFSWTDISRFNDVEINNAWKGLVEEKKALTGEAMMACLNARCRDNARAPMQWDSSPNAGFTKGKPWLPVSPNHTEINAEKQRDDPESIFSFYKRLIQLRKSILLSPKEVSSFFYRKTSAFSPTAALLAARPCLRSATSPVKTRQ